VIVVVGVDEEGYGQIWGCGQTLRRMRRRVYPGGGVARKALLGDGGGQMSAACNFASVQIFWT